jgi:membrane peptidoglycan carboxypeptidase
MPRTTHIVGRRLRRQRRSGRGGRVALRGCGLLLFGFAVLTFFLFVGGVSGALAVYDALAGDLPDFTEIERLGEDPDASFETSKIYAWGPEDANGNRELVLIYEVIDPLGGDRQWLKLDAMPGYVADATVAIEDKSFWTNRGYDLEGIARAFYEYVWLGGAIQGGSSITQQLVKNHLIAEERRVVGAEVGWDDYRRKAEEVLLAQRLSQTYSKEQILEWYLNSNFYGNLAYGIEAAARVYFQKPAAQLTLPEAAMLAAIPQSPALNPIDNPEEAKTRQERVLDAMFQQGMITREELVTAKYTPISPAPGVEERYDIIAPHFALYVRKQLEERFGPEAVLRGGLRVYTTLDLEMQRQAECVARAHVARLSGALGDVLPADEQASCRALVHLPALPAAAQGVDHQVNNAAVVTIDPRTGELKVMVGSLDYWEESIDGSFNVAVDGLRQPGSAFKPFTYLTALSQGYTAATMVLDVETDFGTPYNGVAYVPQNYDGQFHGPMRIRQALGSSYNVPAVEVMSWVGVNNVIRTAHSLGITSLEGSPASQYGLSLTLGGGEVRLIDMVYAFGVLDNMGTMIGEAVPADEQRLGYRGLDPVAILRVENRNGEVLYAYNQPEQRDIVTPQLSFIMNDMLSDRQARCAGFGCPNALELPDNRPAAVKTGTTNDFRDAWTVGYTPQLVTGVWAGNTDNSPMGEVPGSRGAAPIWRAFMAWALEDEVAVGWSQPAGIVQRTVCETSGLLPTPLCPTASEYFVEGTEPGVTDTIFQEVRVNRETGRLATVYTPPELVENRVYRIYPEAAADWVREQEIPQPPTEFDTIPGQSAGSQDAAIREPAPFAFVRAEIEVLGSAGGDGFAGYRLAYFPGLSPTAIQPISEGETTPRVDEVLGTWDVSGLNGLYTLLLTVQREDGSFNEVSVPLTIDNTAPDVQIRYPIANQSIFTDEEWVIIQAYAEDDVSLASVEFYADNAENPFAVSTVPPFTEKWRIRGAGCHTFRVAAVDAAGNRTLSEAVPVCLVERGE